MMNKRRLSVACRDKNKRGNCYEGQTDRREARLKEYFIHGDNSQNEQKERALFIMEVTERMASLMIDGGQQL